MSSVSARLRWLIALTPVFPPLYLAAFAALRYWRLLGSLARNTIAVYFLTQLLAALFTPHPLMSLTLAASRSLFVISLLLAGVAMRDATWLRYLLVGATIVLSMAFYTSWANSGGVFFLRRLTHPYYTTVSLALLAVLVIWILLSWSSGPLYLKIALAILSVSALAYSGSRGALAALVIGVLAAAAIGRNGRYLLGVVVSMGLLLTAYFTTALTRVVAFERLLDLTHLSGRDAIWKGALNAFIAHPLGGVGPYQLGPWLDTIYNGNCTLWRGLVLAGYRSCPEWLAQLRGVWLIAHNTFLHSLGETGLIGTVGLLALIIVIGYATIVSKNSLLISIFFGYLTLGLVDNPTAVPSLHLAEVFWVAGGMALARSGLAVPLEQGLAVDQDQPGPDPL